MMTSRTRRARLPPPSSLPASIPSQAHRLQSVRRARPRRSSPGSSTVWRASGWMNRMTQFKDKAGKDRENASLGLLAYPSPDGCRHSALSRRPMCLSATTRSSILELARDIAQKFNSDFSKRIACGRSRRRDDDGRGEGFNGYFPLTEPLIEGPAPRVMSLRDGYQEDVGVGPVRSLAHQSRPMTRKPSPSKFRKAKTDPAPLPETTRRVSPAVPEARQSHRHLCRTQPIAPSKDVISEYGGPARFPSSSRFWLDLAVEQTRADQPPR